MEDRTIRERLSIEEERGKTRDRYIEKQDIRIEKLEGVFESWNTLIRNMIIKTVMWLIGVVTIGITFGWNLPDNLRKALAEWIAR